MADLKKSPIPVRIAFVGGFALTLLTWVFFYIETPEAPLTAQSTLVVFGFWFGFVFIVHRIWIRLSAEKALKRLRKRKR